MATYDKTAPDDFESAFNADTPAGSAQTEDEAFGITPEGADDVASDAGTEGGEPAAVVILADAAAPAAGTAPADAGAEASANASAASDAKAVTDEANAKAATEAGAPSTGSAEAAGEGSATQPEGAPDATAAAAAEEAGETPAVEAAEVAAGGLDDLSDVPPEDLQKAKSWIGRLRKIEADLKAKGDSTAAEAAPVADAIEQGSIDKLEEGDEAGAQKLDDLADQVASGEISEEEAKQAIAADFGDNFVKMIEAIARGAAGKTADEKLGPMSQNVDQVISHLTDQAARTHFEQIYQAHPDFVEIDASPEFKAFVAAEGAQQVVDSGSASEINKLLAKFKDSKPAAEEAAAEPAAASAPVEAAPADTAADDAAADDAEGVRSTGMRLPEQPTRGSEDFAAAWNEF